MVEGVKLVEPGLHILVKARLFGNVFHVQLEA